MFTLTKITTFGYIALGFILLTILSLAKSETQIPHKIAVANYGPHSSLEETIKGLKDGLKELGFVEGTDIAYDIMHVNFDLTLIPQMLATLKAHNPEVIVTLSTPISQTAKHSIKDVPIVFAAITDPIQAKLVQNKDKGEGNIAGTSDKQDLLAFLDFVKTVLGDVKSVGLLYATSEDNDAALVKMLEEAALAKGIKVVAVSVDHPRDIPMRIQQLKGKVDFIYVGTSGTIQPALPAIIAQADKMNIPVFNVDAESVKAHQSLGCFGVSYHQVGINTSKIISKILKGEKPDSIPVLYPSLKDHRGFISKVKARKFNIKLPKNLNHITFVGE